MLALGVMCRRHTERLSYAADNVVHFGAAKIQYA